jgi:hypothetical protein
VEENLSDALEETGEGFFSSAARQPKNVINPMFGLTQAPATPKQSINT